MLVENVSLYMNRFSRVENVSRREKRIILKGMSHASEEEIKCGMIEKVWIR
jgi:hypothetical protein